MKIPKLLLVAVALSCSMSAFSQQETQKTQKSETEKKETKSSTWGVYPPPAVSQTESAAAAAEAQSRSIIQSFPAPNFGTYYIPVLGNYTSSASGTEKQITITADEKNIGKVWIEGLAPIKIYALLKSAPGTYKIPTQKQAQEGTLIYDDAGKQVSACLGCGYKDSNPAAAVEVKSTSSKTKKKSVLHFTGLKTDQGNVTN